MNTDTRDSTQRQRRLAAIAAAAERLGGRYDDAGRTFVTLYYAQADLEMLEYEPERLAAAALGHLAFGRQRAPRTAKVRVFNPTDARDGYTAAHTIVETVNDDMPFLVDSLGMALRARGHTIHDTIHPLLAVKRQSDGSLERVGAADAGPDPIESFIRFAIARETDTALLRELETALTDTLRDVRMAVDDWTPMLERLRAATAELRATASVPDELKAESAALLEWLAADHFTLLGYREYSLTVGEPADRLEAVPGTGLGLLRGEPTGAGAVVSLAGRGRDEARSPNPLVVTKSSERSTVHRPALFDHIGVKVFDPNGMPARERRFIGLYTSSVYSDSPRLIPLVRLKIRHLLEESGFDRRSHRGRSLQHVLETLPRDDLFQASIEELRTIGNGILDLQTRHRVKLFCRRETFGRFFSCLVYLPRDQYNARARGIVEDILKRGLHGHAVDTEVTLSESALARLAVTVHVTPGDGTEPDTAALQNRIEQAVRSWHDRLREALLAELPEERALALLRRFGEHFSAAYQEDADAARASQDVQRAAAVDAGTSELELALTRPLADHPSRLKLITCRRGEPIALHRALPILENLGCKVVSERVYELTLVPQPIVIQDFELDTPTGLAIDLATTSPRFKECFARTLTGNVENDAFNGLVISAGLDWREAVVMRALCKYLVQTRIGYSQPYMQEVLGRYPGFCRALIDTFTATFDVDRSATARSELRATSRSALDSELARTTSLDDDAILHAYAAVVEAILRTNYYQHDAAGGAKPYVSFKLDPRHLSHLPKPRPMFEVFVYSPRVEGVHLRSSAVARGGIRWSDRREDFRTEVLGLMKAQQVKNTVIVPNGAKGGFVCKALPAGDRDAIQREVVACYQTFIRALLDVTDNVVAGEVRPPARVLRKDGDDPYLVVAADKGTATFSDLANALAAEYDFWLGDAFASGGSAGYDHKKIGITARGAWVAVQRHFRELGLDPLNSPFTVVGIGDMSGDVFGNGLLSSPHMRLVAAFNHQHIFIDPSPDAAASFAERQRLFALPRSTWDDYDRRKLSPGGGVYSRQSKSIELSPAAQTLLTLPTATVTPPELIRAILKAPVDLLWNGGIGTYVKSSSEAQADAADTANDVLRVDGKDLRCRVVAEGGNLGFTQRGRIEYAQRGGRINTDFVDNSGGVDCSDREVNIKILLAEAIRRGALPAAERNTLLAAMTDDVAAGVLGDSYSQTLALSVLESRAVERLGEHVRVIRLLESQGLLDRALELLPTDEQLEERRARGLGLTRPELAILLAYSKLALINSLATTDIPEDPYLAHELATYFPPRLVDCCRGALPAHRLRREIVALLVGGSMINRMSPSFVLRAEEETGASVARVARTYAVVREVFGVRKLWRDIESLDGQVPAKAQYDAIFATSRMVRRGVYWLLQNPGDSLDIEADVRRLQPPVREALAALPSLVGAEGARRLGAEAQPLVTAGLPAALAAQVAALGCTTQMLDIVELARQLDLSVTTIGREYFALGRELRFDILRDQLEGLAVDGRWRARARATLRERLADEQRALLKTALTATPGTAPAAALTGWLARHAAAIEHAQHAIDDMRATGSMDFATLSVALEEIAAIGRRHSG